MWARQRVPDPVHLRRDGHRRLGGPQRARREDGLRPPPRQRGGVVAAAVPRRLRPHVPAPHRGRRPRACWRPPTPSSGAQPCLWLELVAQFGATCTPVPSFALPLVLRRGRSPQQVPHSLLQTLAQGWQDVVTGARAAQDGRRPAPSLLPCSDERRHVRRADGIPIFFYREWKTHPT
jgi:hypothetical protein